jgi:HD-GYP domain-containing protein (c-di-GMP phosphodiesterase class II)
MKTIERFNPAYLEAQIDICAREVRVKAEIWSRFMAELGELKAHNEFMYTHSLRVGLYAYGLAKSEGQDNLKFPLFAGCGHDIGKCEIANSLLDSKNLQPEEFEVIKEHATRGYEKLKDTFLYTGLIAGLHHKYKDQGGYGIDLELDAPFELSEASRDGIKAMAQLVMLADFFDALTTRDNNKGFIEDPNDPIQKREVMLRFFPDATSRVDWLIANRVV